MSSEATAICLSEWETRGPDDCLDLAGRYLDSNRSTASVVEQLNRSRLLKITELRRGLELRAFSHVGRVQIGNLQVTIRPKITGTSLLSLVRYAYGFRKLQLVSDTSHLVDNCGIEDLLIVQLICEVKELISRGLSRAYILTRERLSSPRGRIDIARMVLDGGTITASLPCQHYPRVEDTLLNQVLLAGLRLAASIASVLDFKRDCLRLASQLDDQVTRIRLDRHVLDEVAKQMNRLHVAYAPAASIIRLLVESQGVVLEGQATTAPLSGFLFNMNSFFQALLSRFLRDNLPDHTVQDERQLKGMMTYNSNYHRPPWKSPTPRPDFAVTQRGKLCALLDAKYRDLWTHPLPPQMLYQLVVYAISQHSRPQSSILYPTSHPLAKEVRIDIADPLHGRPLGQVCLRPVLLPKIESLIGDQTAAGRRERTKMAQQLAFGASLNGD